MVSLLKRPSKLELKCIGVRNNAKLMFMLLLKHLTQCCCNITFRGRWSFWWLIVVSPDAPHCLMQAPILEETASYCLFQVPEDPSFSKLLNGQGSSGLPAQVQQTLQSLTNSFPISTPKLSSLWRFLLAILLDQSPLDRVHPISYF